MRYTHIKLMLVVAIGFISEYTIEIILIFDDSLDLSILLSEGKEINKDCLSKGD